MNRHEAFDRSAADRLLALMEAGTSPFQVPWDRAAGNGFSSPYNPTTGKAYRGGNLFQLWCAQQELGYADNRWMTYRQALAVGGQVRKGEKCTLIKYFQFPDPDAPAPAGETEEERALRLRPLVRYPQVFNAAQIDGLPAREPTQDVSWQRADCQAVLDRLGVPVVHGGNDAYYVPSSDEIHLPHQAQFHSEPNYWAVLLHECGHATGHPSRLARDLTGRFNTESYAREELIAETASMLMGERLGIGFDPSGHAAYVKHWIKLLQDDPRELYRAASQAEKACEFLGVPALVREPLKAVERSPEPVAERPTPRRRPRAKGRAKPRERAMAL